MLSRNNFKEQIRKQESKKQRFAIRKLTVGVASVLIGFTLMGMSVSADTTANTENTADKSNDQTANVDSNVPSVTKQVTLQGGSGQSQRTNSDVQTVVNNNANTNSDTQTFNVKQNDQATVSELAESKATQNQSLRGTETATVATWQEFVNAMNNSSYGTITLTNDINVGKASGVKIAGGLKLGGNPGKMQLTGQNISGGLIIDGQNHIINFGDNYLSFTTANQKNSDPWNITFKNMTINSNGRDKDYTTYGGAFSPIYMGGDDIDTKLLARNKVTFENITADIKNGAFYNTTMNRLTADDPYTTVTFKGTNNITCEAVNVKGSAMYNYSSAVEASHIIFAKGTNTTFNVSTAKTNNDTNAGGNILRAKVEDPSDTESPVIVEEGATVNLNGKSKEVRGIVVNDALKGDVDVNGTLNADMGQGHSSVIMAGNLNIGSNGVINIETMQDNNNGKRWANGVANYDGVHYAPIALGVGWGANITPADAALNIADGGKLLIKRGAVKTITPLISFGTGGENRGINYKMIVGAGSVLDLQDAATTSEGFSGYPYISVAGSLGNTNDIYYPGMIHMFGEGSKDSLGFGNVKYVNLQRTGSQRGVLISLEGGHDSALVNVNGTNQASINGEMPLAQWMLNNKTAIPDKAWLIQGLTSVNGTGNTDVNFIPANTTPEVLGNDKQGMLFGQSSGQVTMVPVQSATNASYYNNGTIYGTNGSKGLTNTATYLQDFLDNFNWWTPRRLSFGTALLNNSNVVTQADKYRTEVKTITTNAGNKLASLNIKDGVKDVLDQNLKPIFEKGTTTPDLSMIDFDKSKWGIDWSKTPYGKLVPQNKLGQKLTNDDITSIINSITNTDSNEQAFEQKNARTLLTAYNTLIDDYNMTPAVDSDGNLVKKDAFDKDGNLVNAATATIVYTDGSIDFVNIPVQVNSIADQAVEVGLATSTWDSYREIQIARDPSTGKISYYRLNYDATKKVPLSQNYKASDFVKAHDSSDTLYEGVTYSFDAATQKLLDNNDDHTILAANNGSHYVKLGIIATYKDGSTKNLSGRLTILEFPVFKPIYTKFGQLPTPDISWVQNAGDKDTPWLVQSVDKNYATTPTVNDADLGYSQYSVPVYYGATNGELDENGNLINATARNTPVWDFLDGMYIINPQAESHYRFEDQVDNFKTLTSGTINQSEGSATLNFDINGKSETSQVNTGEVSFGDYLKQLKYNGLFNSMPNNTSITGKWDQSDRSKAGVYHLTYHFNYGKQGNTQQVQKNGNVFDDAGNTSYGLVDGIFNGFTKDSDGNYTQDITADLYVLKEPVGGTLKINRGDSTAFADLDKRFGDDQIVTNLDPDNPLNPRSIDKTKGWLKGVPSNTKSSDNQVETTYVVPINGGTSITRAANVHIIVLTDADQYDLRGGSMFMWNDNTALAKALSNGVELSRLKTARNFMNGFLRPTTTNGKKNFSSIYDVIGGTRKADQATLIKWNLNDVSQSGLKSANVTITYPDGSTDVVKMNVYVIEEPHFVRYNQTRPQSGSISIDANDVVGNVIDGKDGHPSSVKWVTVPTIDSATSLGIYPESKANIYVQYALPTDANGQALQLVGWPKNGFKFSVPTIFITHDIQTTVLKGKTNVTAIDSNINTNQSLSLKTIANDGTTQTFSPQSDGTMVSANGQVWGTKLLTSKLAVSDARNLSNLVDLGGLSSNDYALSWEKTPTVKKQKLTGMIRAQLGNNMFISIPVDRELVADSDATEPTRGDSTITKPTEKKPTRDDSTATKPTEIKPAPKSNSTLTEPVADDGEVSDLTVAKQTTPVSLSSHETDAIDKQQDGEHDQQNKAAHHALPQTGNHDSAIAGLGLAGIMTMFGLLGKRHRQD